MNITHLHTTAFLISLLCVVSCGDSSDNNQTPSETTPTSTTADVGVDTADQDTDPQEDSSPSTACADILTLNSPFLIAPNSPTTQIHAAATFTGDSILVTFNLREQLPGSSNFDIYALALSCDGTLQKEPFRVTTTQGTNRIEPSIATGPQNTLISWQSDNSIAPDNLDIFYRIFDNTLTPASDDETLLIASRNGTPNLSNAWMTQPAALLDGSFALVGAWGHDDAPAFQTFVQRIQADGSLQGDAVDLDLNPAVSQFHPTIAPSSNGDLRIAWTQADNDTSNENIAHTTLPASSNTPNPPTLATTTAASLSSYSTEPSSDTSFLAMSILNGSASNIDILVKRGDDFSGQSSSSLILGEPNTNEHTPTVAANPDGSGAVAWFRTIQGFRNTVHVTRFDAALNAVTTVDLPTESPAAPYAPVLLHIQDHTYFVAWSEGDSPDFFLKGIFVDLSN